MYGKKAQEKEREMPTRGYVRMDGLLGGGVCRLRRVSPISRPALVGEFEKMVCKRCCARVVCGCIVADGTTEQRALDMQYRKGKKKDIPDNPIPE